MGKRKQKERQGDLWVATSRIVESPGHAFYERLEALLRDCGFDRRVEHLCRRFYRSQYGRPSIAPGVYFRLLLIGFFEGLDSERGIAWRVADSLSLRKFIGYGLDEKTPDHSTISRTRRLFWLSTHKAIFSWALKVVEEEGLLSGKTVGVDATTLEANAAMRSIVRRDTGQGYDAYVKQLARAAGLEDPTPEQQARFDRKRKKKTSNREWMHPHDPDARVTRMKDGRTHLAHKAEHAVDLETGAVVAITLQAADLGDTTTMVETLREAQRSLKSAGKTLAEVVMDKGYHSAGVLKQLHEQGIRTYIAEPDRGKQKWKGKEVEQRCVYANRRRLRGRRGKRLQRKRGEFVERPFAHTYDTGGMRRVHLRGRRNILKRVLVQGAGVNLALVMRNRYGAGKPRQAHGQKSAFRDPISTAFGDGARDRALRWLRHALILWLGVHYRLSAGRSPSMSARDLNLAAA